MGLVSRLSLFLIFFLLLFSAKARIIRHISSELVSDGSKDSFLVLKSMDSSEECEQMYGFLPCSNTLVGHLFLILVYEYLLFHGESYLANGGERIFEILGPGVFGATAFQVIGFLPEALILLASGLLNSKEVAQEYVYTGVGLLAGSTIFLLTIVWGSCVIGGNQDLPNNTSSSYIAIGSSQPTFQGLLSSLTCCGITADLETTYTARIMVLSVIPFSIIPILKLFSSSSGEDYVILIGIILSVLFLLFYFFYQFFRPWIQQRRLEYVKHEHLVIRIVQHFQKHALGGILTEDGAPNVNAIRRLFEKIDQDGDERISPSEIKELLHEIKYAGKNSSNIENAIAEVMKEFDVDSNQKITKDEFISGCSKWLDETKQSIDQKYHSQKSWKTIYQVFQPWIQNRREEREMKKNVISEILKHVQSNVLGTLLTENGAPDVSAIRRLFEKMDHDGDNCISQQELKELIMGIKFGKVPSNIDKEVERIMEELDTNGDHMINEEEFINGFSNWLNLDFNQIPLSTNSQDDSYQKSWEETEKLVEVEKGYEEIDRSEWGWMKAIMLMILGFVMLAVLAEPLIHSVQNFSEAANIPSFFISFILVPLATNARTTTSAIMAACTKTPRTTSLTFSEIYGGVFMNNILGLSVLLSIIYVRALTWEFSAELLVVFLVSIIVGLIASFKTTFQLWTSFLAYLLYPLSLLLVFVLNND